ncbi:MAG: carboxylesterase family protein [Acidobacteriota bacterium]|nr:MAG: carboxylesterase family protein [Acidobacteriota bacterium]
MKHFFALLLLLVVSPLPAQLVVVQIASGSLAGKSSSGITVFKGIPYAAPPVGDLRWRPPQPPAKWDGVRQADKFSDSCMQTLTRSRNPWTKEFMVQNDASEDCLCLNVWTGAKLSAAEKRPVLVWIHGGGFNEGSGEVITYDGEELAKKGLVVVTINYRLGVFGFLTHPDLTAESPNKSSGNYGLLDSIAALQWVRKNIASFGGDPANVTVAGQSAGAIAVHTLIASPLAKGLFHRAIAESGLGFLRGRTRLAAAEQEGVKWAQTKGAASIRDLRAKPASELMGGARFSPIADGWLLPDEAGSLFAMGKLQSDVPIMAGLTADEGSAAPTYGKLPPDAFINQAKQRYGDHIEEFMKLYPSNDQAKSGLSQKQSARDQGLTTVFLWAADRAKTSRSKTFTYYFSRGIPWPEHPEFGAFHSADFPYFFNNLKMLDRPWEPADRRLADAMSSYWVNFARTGDPNGRALPKWPAFEKSQKLTMELGEKIGVRPVAEMENLDFYTRFLTQQR